MKNRKPLSGSRVRYQRDDYNSYAATFIDNNYSISLADDVSENAPGPPIADRPIDHSMALIRPRPECRVRKPFSVRYRLLSEDGGRPSPNSFRH